MSWSKLKQNLEQFLSKSSFTAVANQYLARPIEESLKSI